MNKIDVVAEIRELKNKLCYAKNIGFFFGAGTSCALGIPNIAQLTRDVEASLKGESLNTFKIIKDDLKETIKERVVNIEDILNQLRGIRDLTKGSKNKEYQNVSGKIATEVDIGICKSIYQIITEKESKACLTPTKRFFAWYNLLNRDFTKEVFTTNYDLVIEKALESSEIPYFDGFVGSIEPFFWQESIDHLVNIGDLTKNWIRIWKLHGSLSWFWRNSDIVNSHRIIRIGNIENIKEIKNELVIYPSKDKYDSSRKRPFIAYFDRMRDYLLSGELLFIISGYSFSDQHINDIILTCMRQNNRLFIVVFSFTDVEVENFYNSFSLYMNLHVFGPTKTIINGELWEWNFNKDATKPDEITETFWNAEESELKLGDFNNLVNFLVASSGKLEDKQGVVP